MRTALPHTTQLCSISEPSSQGELHQALPARQENSTGCSGNTSPQGIWWCTWKAMLHTSKTTRNFLSLYPCKSTSNVERSTSVIAPYPGLTPAFVACSTNVGEGLVKLSHMQW